MIPKSIYLATPADQAGRWDAEGGRFVSWVDALASLKDLLLGRYPGYIFDPTTLYSTSTPNSGDMFYLLDMAMDQCDLFVAVLPAGVPSLGVPTEIEQAARLGKAILLLTDLEGTSWVVEKWKSRFARLHVAQLSESAIKLDEAFDWIDALPDNPEPYMGKSGQVIPFAPSFPPLPELQAPSEDLQVPSWVNPSGTQQLLRAVQDHDPDERTDVLKVKILDPAARVPQRAYRDDAGFDLHIIADTIIAPGGAANMPCGVAVQLPSWAWGMLTGRSSMWAKGLHIPVSVIDAGWRGPLFVPCLNLSNEPVTLLAGDRVGQMIILDNATRDIESVQVVDELDEHERGERGFGSSGR